MFIYKIFYQTASLCRLIIVHEFIYLFHKTIQTRQYPSVDLWSLCYRYIFFFKRKSIYIRIQSKKLIRIIKSTKKFTLYFFDTFTIKFQIIPGRSIGDEIPACSISSVCFNGLEWIYHITQTLTHFVAIL